MIYTIQQKANDDLATRVAHWFASVLVSDDESDSDTKGEVAIDDLIELATMTEEAELSSTAAKGIFVELMNGATNPRHIAEAKNLLQVSDESEIATIVDQVLADPASQKAVDDIQAGNDKAIGYLVGQVMKQSHGKANPGLAQKLIRERL